MNWDEEMAVLDKIDKAHKFKVKYCSASICRKCPYSYINNGSGTPCKDLTIDKIIDIYNKLNKRKSL